MLERVAEEGFVAASEVEDSAAGDGVLPRLLAEEAMAYRWQWRRRGPMTRDGSRGVPTMRGSRQKRASAEEGSK